MDIFEEEVKNELIKAPYLSSRQVHDHLREHHADFPEVETFLKRCRFPYGIGYGLTETAPLLCNAVVGKTVVGSTGMDEEGRYFIRGRLKNVILNASGENIYPEEIEEVINTYPGVNESLVVQRNERLVALVQLEEGLKDKVVELKESILKYVNGKVGKKSALAMIEIMKEPFQKTATQKIRRFLYSQTISV